ncbi:hypothetical protein BGZ61DRAFT_488021 [Ilyonectria robusta]|uniref:uncharacterized protein n=1 Tax=Ilyonectria robusta TaxID=1079257 RepID=UPI001E8D2A03|nr:uncharacterized protein BGZ61DRAFT_488021 [Ilyonectria robusta]KAH8648861.1 hypothetical protein BGZ61DRAFT_488021 [Ilyonectria robusta]
MHVYPFPQTDEWENQWFFFDVQLHPYQLHFRRRVEDGDESAVGMWEDSYAELAQVRGQMCVQHLAPPRGWVSPHQENLKGTNRPPWERQHRRRAEPYAAG